MGPTKSGSALIPPSGETAAQLYLDYASSYGKITDPVLKVAYAYILLNVAMSTTIKMKGDAVADISKKIADAHDLMTALNEVNASLAAGASDDQEARIFDSGGGTDADKAEAQAFYDRLIAAGVPKNGFRDNPPINLGGDGHWELAMHKDQIAAANTAMQGTVDDLGSTSQESQLDLQTLMNRFNSVIEGITAAIKKYENEAVAAGKSG